MLNFCICILCLRCRASSFIFVFTQSAYAELSFRTALCWMIYSIFLLSCFRRIPWLFCMFCFRVVCSVFLHNYYHRNRNRFKLREPSPDFVRVSIRNFMTPVRITTLTRVLVKHLDSNSVLSNSTKPLKILIFKIIKKKKKR